MKHETLDELRLRAELLPANGEIKKMSRRERLRRWADVLDQHAGPVRPFFRVEYLTPSERRELRGDDTPLAVAFSDPILRADGLPSDRLGDGLAYFDIPEHTGHRLLCDCHYSGTMTGENVAARLRGIAEGGVFRQLWEWATGRGDGR
jgi:hypothetical protein